MSAIFLFVRHLPVCNTRLSYILTNQKIRKGSRQIDADLQREALNVTKHRFGNFNVIKRCFSLKFRRDCKILYLKLNWITASRIDGCRFFYLF